MDLEQKIRGSRKPSNIVIGVLLLLGGTGFVLASTSSYLGRDLLPLSHPSTLLFIPQGLIMGLYGAAALLLGIYLWALISIDFGSGLNKFDKNTGLITITRRGIFRNISIDIPIKDVTAVKLEVKEGLNPRRKISLRIKGRKDLPISRAGSPQPLIELEKEGAELAKFLEVNLEG
ncbi:photosystem I assembly protein Ycf4 [Prochlorococcus sp. MIT 1341]|uniref:photosystem I assembly protein Ycf4 n=1 Tax=Prochlorococcus sp. MIT 1341 TaxID=3096221 RepID=UPI0039BF46BB